MKKETIRTSHTGTQTQQRETNQQRQVFALCLRVESLVASQVLAGAVVNFIIFHKVIWPRRIATERRAAGPKSGFERLAVAITRQ